jgi:curved DNA-binding protein
MYVNGDSFIDYYDLMQVSPNADDDTIQRIFRHLAQKWHPDHHQGDPDRFKRLVEAHKILSNPETRAAYDVKYQKFWDTKWKLAAEASGSQGFMDDKDVRERMLSLYYVERRSRMHDPGLGEMEVARLLRIPIELIDFHIWYLKEKGWIQRLENGQLAITAPGVDQVESGRLRLTPDRLLTAHGSDHEEDDGKGQSESVRSFPVQDKDRQR